VEKRGIRRRREAFSRPHWDWSEKEYLGAGRLPGVSTDADTRAAVAQLVAAAASRLASQNQ
jgi:hypothetical protein